MITVRYFCSQAHKKPPCLAFLPNITVAIRNSNLTGPSELRLFGITMGTRMVGNTTNGTTDISIDVANGPD